MKNKYVLLSALALLPFSQLSHAQDTVTQSVNINNSLTTALQQVDTDGEFLKIEKASDLMEKIAAAVDKYILPIANEKNDIPAGFSFEKLLNITGLTDITASSKSIKKHGENYFTKSFIQTNGSRKGLLSLLGKADQPWASLEYAPRDTILLLETHLDLSAVPQIMRQIAPMIEADAAKKMLAGLNEKDPIAGNTVEQILANTDARISIVAELDHTKTWKPEGKSEDLELPSVQATGRIDGIAQFIWKHYGETLTKNLPMQSKGNVHTVFIPEQIDAPWGKLTPQLVIDVDNNHIWISLSAEHLAVCKEGKSKLINNKDFQLVNQHQSKTGAARFYISSKIISKSSGSLQKRLEEELLKKPELLEGKEASKEFLDDIFTYLQSLSSISTCISHDDKGMHIHTHAPFPIKQIINPSYIYASSAFAGLSYGPVMKQLEAADRMEDITKMRHISTALLGYYSMHNKKYPDNLQQLVEATLITEDFFELNDRELHYVKGWDAYDGSKIIIYTTADENGKVIAGYVDGTLQAISEEQLKKELKKQ